MLPTVLIASDRRPLRSLLASLLESSGIRARQTARDATALVAAVRDQPALVLLDGVEPFGEAEELLAELGHLVPPWAPHVVVLGEEHLEDPHQLVLAYVRSGGDDNIVPLARAVLRSAPPARQTVH